MRLIAHLLIATAVLMTGCDRQSAASHNYVIVDTGQNDTFDNTRTIDAPAPGENFHGQDAQHAGSRPNYRDNGDGTVSDLVTGLMWVKARGSKVGWDEAMSGAASCTVGGYSDWRAPTLKELYSLIDFNGYVQGTADDSTPFIDVTHFDFAYGDTSLGERIIDCQDWSATAYVWTTMAGDATVFGVNFADGRIKGYPKLDRRTGSDHKLYVRYVRGNPAYGINSFVDGGDGTVCDTATGLTWSQRDSGTGMNWQGALAWVQTKNAENHLGHNNWRLPNAKELQSIVDYSRSPDTTGTAAIDPVFSCTPIVNEGGAADFPFYWTSTTHLDGAPENHMKNAVYVAFGRGLGWMQLPPTFQYALYDVHGAGCQRSDPKSGDPANYPYGFGPQGDVIRINNFVRLVRGPFAAADFNEDGLVDNVDLEAFTRCATGPGTSYLGQLSDACSLAPDADGFLAADFERDGDVDQADFGAFQRCLSGSQTRADSECS